MVDEQRSDMDFSIDEVSYNLASYIAVDSTYICI